MAGPASSLAVPFHPDLRILAQCGRRLLLQAHAPSPQARRVPIRRRPASRYQPLRRRDKRRSQTLRLDRRPKARPRRCQTREANVRVTPLANGSLRRARFFTRSFPTPKPPPSLAAPSPVLNPRPPPAGSPLLPPPFLLSPDR